MADVLEVVREAPRQYARIARLWIRSSLAYRTSFAILTFSSMLITFLDFVGLALMLNLIGDLDGWSLWEIALLYGASGIGILDGLLLQVLWVVILLALCQTVLGAATRKVVVQGG